MHVILSPKMPTSIPSPVPLNPSALSSLTPLERRTLRVHRARTTIVTLAQPSSSSSSSSKMPSAADTLSTDALSLPEGGAAWDPEGLLPKDAPSGGHFARRGETASSSSSSSSTTATATHQPTTSPHTTSTLATNLLAKKTPNKVANPLVATALPTTAPPSQRGGGGDVIISAPSVGIGAAIDAAFRETFWGERGAPRVLNSFRRLAAGQEHVHLFPGQGLQRAESYVEGLTAAPFPDSHSGAYPWLEEIERQADVIKTEFQEVCATPGALAKGTNVWVPASRKDAVGYGKAWRTLVLQDRGVWTPVNSKIFPKTTQLVKDLKAPTLEVFFARQQAGTGISSHTDNANFVQTSHLGLEVPEGEAWIKVGEHKRYWQEGKVMTMDTSFMHETQNESAVKDRYVLIFRHWHPELTLLERIATLFLFQALDDSTDAGIKAAQKGAAKAMKGLIGGGTSGSGGSGGKGKGKAKGVMGGGGFGKK